MDTLKSHFGKDDFYKRDDGIIRLDNKAESYVSGWFGDIAYKRGFLKADSDGDGDGKLNQDEYGNTKNSFQHSGRVEGNGDTVDKISTWIKDTYKSSNTKDKTIINQFDGKESGITIDKQLDLTINKDKDFNSKISFGEALQEHYKKGLTNSIVQLADDMVGLKGSSKRPDILDIDLTMKLLEEEMKASQKQLEALQKLKMEKGNVSTLDKNELKALDGLLPKDTKNISNETIDTISKSVTDKMKIREAYKTQDNESASKIMTLKG
jgi:hypothetical protein